MRSFRFVLATTLMVGACGGSDTGGQTTGGQTPTDTAASSETSTDSGTTSTGDETGSESSETGTETGNETETGGNPACEASCDCEEGPSETWVEIEADTDLDLAAVWVVRPGELWVGGEMGIRRRYEAQWDESIESPSGIAVSDFVVDASDRLHAAVGQFAIEMWSEGSWSSVGSMENCNAIPNLSITPDDTVFAACFYYGGFSRWTDADDYVVADNVAVGGVWALASDHVLAAGPSGNLRYAGHDLENDSIDQWISLPSTPTAGVAVWAAAADDVVIGTSNGELYRGDESQLDLVAELGTDLTAIWGGEADDVWAAGSGGTILHWNGVEWSLTVTPTEARIEDLHGDTCSVWAVGEAGTVWRWRR